MSQIFKSQLFKLFVFLTVPTFMYAMDAANTLLREAAQGVLHDQYSSLIDQANAALALGANIDHQLEGIGSTPLIYAANNNNLEMVRWLIAHGAKPNIPDTSGCTPIFFAANRKNKDVAICLLLHGAEINLRNANGNTLLHLAVYRGHKSTVKFLLQHGADATIGGSAQDILQSKEIRSPLEMAREENYRYPEITRILNRHVCHPAIARRMALFTAINHPRCGRNTAIPNQENYRVFLPLNVFQYINELLHKDAELDPAKHK